MKLSYIDLTVTEEVPTFSTPPSRGTWSLEIEMSKTLATGGWAMYGRSSHSTLTTNIPDTFHDFGAWWTWIRSVPAVLQVMLFCNGSHIVLQ